MQHSNIQKKKITALVVPKEKAKEDHKEDSKSTLTPGAIKFPYPVLNDKRDLKEILSILETKENELKKKIQQTKLNHKKTNKSDKMRRDKLKTLYKNFKEQLKKIDTQLEYVKSKVKQIKIDKLREKKGDKLYKSDTYNQLEEKLKKLTDFMKNENRKYLIEYRNEAKKLLKKSEKQDKKLDEKKDDVQNEVLIGPVQAPINYYESIGANLQTSNPYNPWNITAHQSASYRMNIPPPDVIKTQPPPNMYVQQHLGNIPSQLHLSNPSVSSHIGNIQPHISHLENVQQNITSLASQAQHMGNIQSQLHLSGVQSSPHIGTMSHLSTIQSHSQHVTNKLPQTQQTTMNIPFQSQSLPNLAQQQVTQINEPILDANQVNTLITNKYLVTIAQIAAAAHVSAAICAAAYNPPPPPIDDKQLSISTMPTKTEINKATEKFSIFKDKIKHILEFDNMKKSQENLSNMTNPLKAITTEYENDEDDDIDEHITEEIEVKSEYSDDNSDTEYEIQLKSNSKHLNYILPATNSFCLQINQNEECLIDSPNACKQLVKTPIFTSQRTSHSLTLMGTTAILNRNPSLHNILYKRKE